MKTMKMPAGIVTLVVLASLAGCEEGSLSGPGEELVVVQAYLFAGEPVDDIRIMATLPLGSGDTVAPSINDAVVYLLRDGVRFDLQPSPGDSGYYHYPGADLTVAVGDEFAIAVEYFGRTATAETVVPPPPANVTASADTLFVPEFGIGPPMEQSQLKITWEAVTGGLFFVTIESTDPDPIPIDRPDSFGGTGGVRFVSQPRQESTYSIQASQLSYYGNHRVRIYRINQEYADLYGSLQQDTRDLSEPLTNIDGGLGVFSAFSSVAVDVYVAPETAVR